MFQMFSVKTVLAPYVHEIYICFHKPHSLVFVCLFLYINEIHLLYKVTLLTHSSLWVSFHFNSDSVFHLLTSDELLYRNLDVDLDDEPELRW